MKSIGKYEVLDEIGKSVIGTTYRVRDTFGKRELVLKVLRPLPNLNVALKDAFCLDLSVSSELVHRHLARVFDLGEVEDGIYIATELLSSGAGLHRVITERGDLSLAHKLGILAQVCEGLGFAHSRGIAHGAIKPSNIFVDHNNDIKILDLGTAKWQSFVVDSGNRPEGLLPNYFAPEQILGQCFDSKSDLFSLGLISYEFLAGQYPFHVPAGLIPREIIHSEPEPLRTLKPDLPEELEQVLIRALKKKPEERLQTAEEFAAALYGIAQQVRRGPVASSAVPASSSDPVPAPAPGAPSVEQDRPAKDDPGIPVPVAAAAEGTPAVGQSPAPETKTPSRKDVQGATAEAPPWTARSYAATSGTRNEERGASPSAQAPSGAKTSAAGPDGPSRPEPHSSALPARVPVPVSSVPMRAQPVRPPGLRARPVTEKLLKRRLIAIGAGAVLAVYAVLSFISHQGLHASQNPGALSVAVQPSADPVAKKADRAPSIVQSPVPPPVAQDSGEPAAAPPAVEQIPRKQIRALWEAGNYAEAMRVVDDFLVTSPANAEARGWKKKIRAAQEAEAAIK